MKARDIIFTALDNLTGLTGKAHKVMAQTELCDELKTMCAAHGAYVQFDKFGAASVHFNADKIEELLNISHFVIPDLLGGIDKSRL